MSGVGIALDTSEMTAAFERLSSALTDMTPVFDGVGDMLVTSTQHRFETQTDPTGAPWEPLSPVTILQRLGGPKRVFKQNGQLRKGVAEKAASLKILQRLGHLLHSITRNAAPDHVEVGSNMVYARIHQLGGQAGRGKKVTIPQRAYLGLDDADQVAIVDIVRRHLSAAAEG